MSVEARAPRPIEAQISPAGRKLREYLAYRQRTEQRSNGPFDNVSVENVYDGSAAAATVLDRFPRYMNHGYWDESTKSTEEASDNLMSRIVAGVRRHTGYST